MADKGLVFDFTSPKTGKVRYVLTPPVVGFFEFTMMRVHPKVDQGEAARILHRVMFEERAFAAGVFEQGDAVLGRAMIHEDVLALQPHAEVLDYQKATWLIEEAGGGGLSPCYCRHKGAHLGHPCEHPEEVCTTLQPAADFSIRHGFARPAAVSELLEVLAMCRERGLVQIADNVQRNPIYICHCCGCHCGQLLAITHHGLKQAVRTSPRIATVDSEACTGCGRCARRCPIGAIALKQRPREAGGSVRMAAMVDESLCLGCGVCHAACTKARALSFPARPERVLTPASTMERIVQRAVEKGAVHSLLLGHEQAGSMAWLHRFLGAVENLPPVHRALVSRQLKSRFVAALSGSAKKAGQSPPV
jgi:ferredoxin